MALHPALRRLSAAAAISLLTATAALATNGNPQGLDPAAAGEPIACIIDPVNGGYYCIYRDS